MDTLDIARSLINETDEEMARLFCRRMEAVAMVADYKKSHGLPVLDAEREKAVIAQNSARIEDTVIREYYVNFIKNVMALSRSYQVRKTEGMRVAYSGTEGAFAYLAAKKLFPSAKLIASGSFDLAYKAVESGDCDACVLPVENSTNGGVGQVTDLIFSGSLFVNSALDLSITQDLVGLPEATISDITDVISHPQALGQCEEYINEHHFARHEYTNTALAAKYVAEKKMKHLAAIASADAAALYGLKVIDRSINAAALNTTRFLVLSRSENETGGLSRGERSILIFTVRNEAGALARAIDVIGSYGFNMLTLRSRPMKELLWQYYFYIELEGNIHTENGRRMIETLTRCCDKLKLVGTYCQRQEEELTHDTAS